MRLSAGRRFAIAGLALVVLALWAARINVPRLSGPIKGDEATYVAMAFSLAHDRDLKYKPEDYRRFHRLYGTGPEGIFLKRAFDLDWHMRAGWPPVEVEKRAVPVEIELDYGKPFAYSALAAPFAAVMGLGGLLLLNVLLLALAAWCAVVYCQARTRRVAGALIGLGFIGASVVPVYGAWLTPEIFNFTLVLVAYFLWLYKEIAPARAPAWLRSRRMDWIAALLIGVAAFSKPLIAPLIAPIVATAILRGQWIRGMFIGAAFAAAAASLFGANELIAGDWNYQGGDRNYFVTRFPFDEKGTVFEVGSRMATEEANDENILAPGYIANTLPQNIWYFLIGRDAGLIPYFFPGAVIALLWLAGARGSPVWQWTTALGALFSVLGLLVLAPASWNGGGGPIGNRYFLGLYPALLFLFPVRMGLAPAAAAWVIGLTCIGPIVSRPFAASQAVWLNPERWPLRLLPVEMTLLNNLPVALNPQRWRVLVSSDPEVFLYYMDSNTYFQEEKGFWVSPGTAEIVIRTARPLTGLKLQMTSRIDNRVDLSIDGRAARVPINKDSESTIQLRPEPGLYALASYQIVLRITTEEGFYPQQFEPGSKDTRHLGVFISPAYEVK